MKTCSISLKDITSMGFRRTSSRRSLLTTDDVVVIDVKKVKLS